MENETSTLPNKPLTEKQLALQRRREEALEERRQRIRLAQSKSDNEQVTLAKSSPNVSEPILPSHDRFKDTDNDNDKTLPINLKDLLEQYRKKREAQAIKTPSPQVQQAPPTPSVKRPRPEASYRVDRDSFTPNPTSSHEEPPLKKTKTDDSGSFTKTLDTISAYSVQIVAALALYIISCATKTYLPPRQTYTPPMPSSAPPASEFSSGDFYRLR